MRLWCSDPQTLTDISEHKRTLSASGFRTTVITSKQYSILGPKPLAFNMTSFATSHDLAGDRHTPPQPPLNHQRTNDAQAETVEATIARDFLRTVRVHEEWTSDLLHIQQQLKDIAKVPTRLVLNVVTHFGNQRDLEYSSFEDIKAIMPEERWKETIQSLGPSTGMNAIDLFKAIADSFLTGMATIARNLSSHLSKVYDALAILLPQCSVSYSDVDEYLIGDAMGWIADNTMDGEVDALAEKRERCKEAYYTVALALGTLGKATGEGYLSVEKAIREVESFDQDWALYTMQQQGEKIKTMILGSLDPKNREFLNGVNYEDVWFRVGALALYEQNKALNETCNLTFQLMKYVESHLKEVDSGRYGQLIAAMGWYSAVEESEVGEEEDTGTGSPSQHEQEHKDDDDELEEMVEMY